MISTRKLARRALVAAVSAASLVAATAPATHAVDPVTRTPWQMFVTPAPYGLLGFTLAGHGDPAGYQFASVPAGNDAGWVAAPNTETIGFGGPNASRLGSFPCLQAVDYTYFQTFVTVPTGATVTTFTISFSGMDDGSRVSIYNSDYPAGLVVPGSYVYLGGTGTSDLASYVVEGVNRVVITQMDDCAVGNSLQSASVVLNGTSVPSNQPPVANADTAGNGYIGPEGGAIALAGSASDPDGTTPTVSWSVTPLSGTDTGAACSITGGTTLTPSVTCTDDGSYTVTLTADDGVATPVTSDATLVVSNVAPVVTITSPADASVVGTTVSVTSTVTDAGTNDTHTCVLDWGDGATDSTCSGSHTYAAAGPATITLTATDDDGASDSDDILVTVVQGGEKVTGGGFVVSGGRTSFGFVARDLPALAGQLQARTPLGRFHGSTVTALTATATTATWSGTGRWNGVNGYGYTVSVADNRNGGKKGTAADTIAITIRDGGGATVFSVSAPLQGGNITVH